MTSDAGALLLGATDRAIGLVERFAGCFSDHRAADLVEHTVPHGAPRIVAKVKTPLEISIMRRSLPRCWRMRSAAAKTRGVDIIAGAWLGPR
jgi:hypothetical protein